MPVHISFPLTAAEQRDVQRIAPAWGQSIEQAARVIFRAGLAIATTEPMCRVCGCSELHPCQGGCSWVDVDLCSACAEHVRPKKKSRKRRARR